MIPALDAAPGAAVWLLLAALPFCAWAAAADLSRMRIPNRATDGLLLAFAVVGLLVLPFGDYAWRWAHAAVALALGLGVYAMGGAGGGDVKFAAAASPYVALGDLDAVALVYGACLLVTWGAHRAARATAGPRLAPGWASWAPGRRFPMGVPLGLTLALYLLLAARG